MSDRKIIDRTCGQRHGPITRVVSPSDKIAEHIKPFVFLDYFRMEGIFEGFGLHPHSGIATLTYALEGDTIYEDTSGKTGTLKVGGLEWMLAGGGAWHDSKGKDSGKKSGFQLWVALAPGVEDGSAESHYAAPQEVQQDGPVLVLLGSYGQATSPFETPTSMNYFNVQLKDGEDWHYQPPKGHTVGWLYLYKGMLQASEPIAVEELVVFEESEEAIDLRAVGDTTFMFGSAVKHEHPLVLGRSSVHTNTASLRAGEARIQEIGRKLSTEGRL